MEKQNFEAQNASSNDFVKERIKARPVNKAKLLKNPEDNSLFYYVRDYTRVGWGENGTYYGKLYMKDGIICEEPLLNEYHNEWDSNAENHIHSYEIEENGQWTECEKAVFEQKTL